jgi:hypothetical protein
MLCNDHYPDRGVEYRDAFRRSVPKCYSRAEVLKAASESPIDRESNAVLIGLSVITCVATFVVGYGGWGF